MILAPSLLVALASAPCQSGARPTPAELVDLARGFLPAASGGGGDRRTLLTPAERAGVRAAAEILDAALVLEPEGTYALWWSGHCVTLLGRDALTRGWAEEAEARFAEAVAALDRAIELEPSSYWAAYARGLVRSDLGDPWGAVQDHDAAARAARAAMESESDEAASQDAAFVRFQARKARAEARTAALDFEAARADWESFYADYGANRWDRGYSLADTYLLERDFASARATYEELLEVEEYRAYDATYAQLGYLAGLLGERERAADRLRQALEREFQPTLYPRLWLWILAPEGARAEAEEDLRAFLANPPESLSAWDRRLGAHALGDGDDASFLADAAAERTRRLETAEPLGDLMCEVHFYVGLQRERRARGASPGAARDALLGSALDAHRRALERSPATFKWEWEYARHHLAQLAGQLGLAAGASWTLEGERLSVESRLGDLRGAGEVARCRVHRPGAQLPARGREPLREAARIGDLLQGVLVGEDGARRAGVAVADAQGP